MRAVRVEEAQSGRGATCLVAWRLAEMDHICLACSTCSVMSDEAILAHGTTNVSGPQRDARRSEAQGATVRWQRGCVHGQTRAWSIPEHGDGTHQGSFRVPCTRMVVGRRDGASRLIGDRTVQELDRRELRVEEDVERMIIAGGCSRRPPQRLISGRGARNTVSHIWPVRSRRLSDRKSGSRRKRSRG